MTEIVLKGRKTLTHSSIHHCLRLGDVGTVRKDIDTDIETQYTTPIHSNVWRLGDSNYGYKYGYRDVICHPYIHSHFLDLIGDVGTVSTNTHTEIET